MPINMCKYVLDFRKLNQVADLVVQSWSTYLLFKNVNTRKNDAKAA